MERKFFNISNIYEKLDNFVLAKIEIENEWLADNKIEEPSDFSTFINNIGMHNQIYMINAITNIVYKIIKTKNTEFFFYYYAGKNEESDLKSLVNILDNISENKQKLKDVSIRDLVLGEKTQPDYPYFIIDNTLKIIE